MSLAHTQKSAPNQTYFQFAQQKNGYWHYYCSLEENVIGYRSIRLASIF